MAGHGGRSSRRPGLLAKVTRPAPLRAEGDTKKRECAVCSSGSSGSSALLRRQTGQRGRGGGSPSPVTSTLPRPTPAQAPPAERRAGPGSAGRAGRATPGQEQDRGSGACMHAAGRGGAGQPSHDTVRPGSDTTDGQADRGRFRGSEPRAGRRPCHLQHFDQTTCILASASPMHLCSFFCDSVKNQKIFPTGWERDGGSGSGADG